MLTMRASFRLIQTLENIKDKIYVIYTPAAKCRGSVESSMKYNETGIEVGHLIVRRSGQTEAGAKN